MQARKIHMSPAWVKGVKPEAVPVEYRDTDTRGLVLRVQPSGLRAWWLRFTFKGEDRRFRLGASPAITLKRARVLARRARATAEAGTDPQAVRVAEREKARVGETVELATKTWLEDVKLGPAARWKGGLEGGAARSFLPHVRRFTRELGGHRIADLTPKDIEKFISPGEAPATRNRALTALRGLLTWALRKQIIETDPSAALRKEREAERSRTLSDAELSTLIHGFDATRYGRAVRMLALTGLRRDEVLGACWPWYDADAGVLTIPSGAEKMGRLRGEPRRVALCSAAVALLAEQRAALFAEGTFDREGFIFATTTGARPHPDALKPVLYKLRGLRGNGQPASQDKRAKARPVLLPRDVTIHDVRRTVADALLNRLGAAPWVVDHVVLGHARPKLLRTYMPTLPLGEAREALAKWAEELARILSAGQAQKKSQEGD